MCFDAFPNHKNQVLKKIFFNIWSGEKRVLMHFQATRIMSLKKIFFNVWTCFDAFPDHKNEVLKKIFFNVCSGKKRVLMHFQATRIKSLKKIFFNVKELLKTCLDAFPDHQNQGLKNYFFNLWSG